MLGAILNESWGQHPTKQLLYGHQTAIMKTIKNRRTRHAGHCWRSRDELISDVLLWTPSHGRAKAGRLARTYIRQLCIDTGCRPEDQPVWLKNKDTFCQYNFIKILSSFLKSVLVSGWNWCLNSPKLSWVLSDFSWPSSGVARMYKECF